VQDVSHFTQVILETGPDGRARFRNEAIPLSEGKPAARLSTLMPSGGLQLRESPVGFRSEFHCTENPQWLFVLRGAMEIGLQLARVSPRRPLLLGRHAAARRGLRCQSSRPLEPPGGRRAAGHRVREGIVGG
jgi:hypothetical protein